MIDLENYRKNINQKINNYIDPNIKKILVFGEKFNTDKKNIKLLYLNDINPSYIYFDKNNSINFNFDKNSFDQVISYHGIEKILNPNHFLLNIRKYLVKNGNIIFVVYNSSHLSNIIKDLSYDELLSKNNINTFNYNSLKEIIKNTGFDILSEEVYANFLDRKTTEDIIKITRNPYNAVFSFIINAKKIDKFPFIEGTY